MGNAIAAAGLLENCALVLWKRAPGLSSSRIRVPQFRAVGQYNTSKSGSVQLHFVGHRGETKPLSRLQGRSHANVWQARRSLPSVRGCTLPGGHARRSTWAVRINAIYAVIGAANNLATHKREKARYSRKKGPMRSEAV